MIYKILIILPLIFSAIQLFGQENNQEVFAIVEVPPTPSDGMSGFYKFVYKNLQYPEAAKGNNIQGRVFVQFVVSEKGEIIEEKVVEGINVLLDAEALRIIKLSPNWIPGRISKKGATCKVRMILPITFRLPSEKELKKQEKRKKRKKK